MSTRGYQTKDESALVYDANKRYIRAVAATITQRLLNDALSEMTREFNEGLAVGQVKEVGSLEAVQALMLTSMQRQLPS